MEVSVLRPDANLEKSDRVALNLVDYARGTRLKLMGHMKPHDFIFSNALDAQLLLPGYKAKAQRAMKIDLEGFDWNCLQHIAVRYEAAGVERSVTQRDRRIAELEDRLAQLS